MGGEPGWGGGEVGRGVVGRPLFELENKKVSWFLGFLVSKILGFSVSSFQSFLVSWFQKFKKSVNAFERYLVHITILPNFHFMIFDIY